MTKAGRISDIFFSFQGEGIYLGEPQIFIRLADCNLSPRCLYCDTDIKLNKEMTANEIVDKIKRESWPAKSVSITGGEPLIQADFLAEVLPVLKQQGFTIYLETNGTLPEALGLVIENIDIIAMDIKLPSSGRTAPLWEKHSQFLKIGREKEIMVKVVLTSDTDTADLVKAVSLIEGGPSIPFILQPVTPDGKVKGIGEMKIQEFYALAGSCLKDVRVIPQVHRIMGIK